MVITIITCIFVLFACVSADGQTAGTFSYPENCDNYANDPAVQSAVLLATKASSSVSAFVISSARAKASAQVAVQAISSANSTASSLATVQISSLKCIAADAASASRAVAVASARASATAQAAAAAYGIAVADSHAASYAASELQAKLCSCTKIPYIEKAILLVSKSSIALRAASQSYAQTCDLYATALSVSSSVSRSLSTATGKMCSSCGKGFKAINLQLSSGNTKETSSGSAACSEALRAVGGC